MKILKITKAKFIKESVREEDEMANLKIENFLSTKDDYPLEKYIDLTVEHIWLKLKENTTPEQRKYTGTTKESIKELITEYDSEVAFYQNVYDYFEEGKGFLQAADELYSDIYITMTAQGWAM